VKNFLIKWIVNIATLFIVIHIVAGVSADSWDSIIVAAFVFTSKIQEKLKLGALK